MKKAVSRVKSHLVDRPYFAHPRTLASALRSARRSARKHAQSLGMSDRSVWRILRSDLSLHPYKVQTVHSLSDTGQRGTLAILSSVSGNFD